MLAHTVTHVAQCLHVPSDLLSVRVSTACVALATETYLNVHRQCVAARGCQCCEPSLLRGQSVRLEDNWWGDAIISRPTASPVRTWPRQTPRTRVQRDCPPTGGKSYQNQPPVSTPCRFLHRLNIQFARVHHVTLPSGETSVRYAPPCAVGTAHMM